jgi:site-specific DNA-methyltransferase (adenine-specific)
MKPYYQENGITIYHGDCREVLPSLPKVDLVLTDPPYPDQYEELYRYESGQLGFLDSMECKQIVFWSARFDFPFDYSAIHIWDKKMGAGRAEYDRIFERHGQAGFLMFREYFINSTVAANYTGDVFTGHPSQKPIKLIKRILKRLAPVEAFILDPFMGSGTTLRAAKDLGRKAIGIEIEEKYCEIAAGRLSQEVFQFA